MLYGDERDDLPMTAENRNLSAGWTGWTAPMDWADWTWMDVTSPTPRVLVAPPERVDVVGKAFWLGLFTGFFLEVMVAFPILAILFILGVL